MRVSKPRIDSNKACKETIRIRTGEMAKHRHLTSGGAEIIQLQEEVKACLSVERQQILAEVQRNGFKVEVPTSEILGMKDIPWTS